MFKSSYDSFQQVADMTGVPKAKYYLYNDTTARRYGIKGLDKIPFRKAPSYKLPDKPLEVDPTSNKGRVESVVYFYSGRGKRRKLGEPLKKRTRTIFTRPVKAPAKVRAKKLPKVPAQPSPQEAAENDEAAQPMDIDKSASSASSEVSESPEPVHEDTRLRLLNSEEFCAELIEFLRQERKNNPPTLQTLPAFILKRIISYCLVADDTVEVFEDWSFVANGHELVLGGQILRTCQFFYSFGIPILYGCNTFHTIVGKEHSKGRKPLFFVDKHQPWIRKIMVSLSSLVDGPSADTDAMLASAFQLFRSEETPPLRPLDENCNRQKKAQWTKAEIEEEKRWKKLQKARKAKKTKAKAKRMEHIKERTGQSEEDEDVLCQYLHKPEQVYLDTIQIRIVPLQKALFTSRNDIKLEHSWQKMFAEESELWNALHWTPCMNLEFDFVGPEAKANTTRRRKTLSPLEVARYWVHMDRYYKHIKGWFGVKDNWIHDDAWMDHRRLVTQQAQGTFWNLPKALEQWWESTEMAKKQKEVFDKWVARFDFVEIGDDEELEEAIMDRDKNWLSVERVEMLHDIHEDGAEEVPVEVQEGGDEEWQEGEGEDEDEDD